MSTTAAPLRTDSPMSSAAAHALLSYPPLLRELLRTRGIVSDDDARKFLNPNYEDDFHDPFLLKDMEKAVERILRAVQDDEHIVVYTDYDTDGTPAGVMFRDFFKKIGYTNFQNYIPHRHKEGYGLNSGAIAGFAKEGARLIITADCGISDIAEVKVAREAGIDAIVTDHHLPHKVSDASGVLRDELPPAHAVINPHREDETYPFRELCGSGVAFKLIQALLRRGNEARMFAVHEGWEKWLLDMAAIGTISDMVPLVGENRAIAHYGLKVLRKSPRPGLMKLFRNLSVDQRNITEDDVGFVIGPRINAASRMDDPIHGFYFLSAEDEVAADRACAHLEGLNTKRKWLVANVVKEALARFGDSEPEDSVIVMGNPRWQPGILGLAANTLATRYTRPVFLWGKGESDTIKGSCRSDGSVNVMDLMSRTKECFTDFGGHAFSGGFSVADEKIHFLEEILLKTLDVLRSENGEAPRLRDSDLHPPITLSLDDVTDEQWRIIEKLSPFGKGNPKPVFAFVDAPIRDIRRFGKEKNHIMLVLGSDDRAVNAVDFFGGVLGGADTRIAPGVRIGFTAHLERNIFRGKAETRLRLLSLESL